MFKFELFLNVKIMLFPKNSCMMIEHRILYAIVVRIINSKLEDCEHV
jgi:hypothetical protein